ncbi:pyrroline-5-carboxylate reductase [Pseudochelatococcus sp. B33]
MPTGAQTVQRFADIVDGSGPDPALPSSLVLTGAGKMGAALLGGWLKAGLNPVNVTILDPHPSEDIERLAAERGIALNTDLADIAQPEVLVLAIKPQALDEAAPALRPLVGPGTLVLSILAGKTIDGLARHFPAAHAIVRAMPNLPASIGRGVTGVAASARASNAQRATATALLAGAGAVEWLTDEHLIDALTGVSGSGPAYVFYLVEVLAEAGVAAGLPADLAERLARATVTGAGALLDTSPLSAAALREAVTSKGGTTAAALDVLGGEDGIGPIVTRAVAAAKRRAEELAE